ncbi:MAG: hypothetical protein AB7R89_17675 [Dehalococcoidia bacterium]
MSGERPPVITDADVRSLAAKLKGLHALLTPAEQEVLHALLRQAAAREDAVGPTDTEGFVWGVSFNPFAYLDAIDFGSVEKQEARG